MNLNARILNVFAMLIALMMVACNKNETSQAGNSPQTAIPVNVMQISADSSLKQNYYIGMIEAAVSVPVSFSMPGTVTKVMASEGQFVSAGSVLAEIDETSSRSSLEMMESTEKQVRDAYERLSKVYKEGSLPEIKFIEIQSKLDQSVAATKIARKNVQDCILKAPLSGYVAKRSIEPGSSTISIGAAFTICKIDRLKIKISIPESEIPKIKIGDKAEITITALGDQEFYGKVDEIGVSANAITHTYDVKMEIAKPGNKIKPGMVCNVYLKNVSAGVAVSVPSNAVMSDRGQQFVFVLNADGKSVRKQVVTVGTYNGNNIMILSGVNVNDKVVIAGQQKMYDNAAVIVAQ